MSKFTFGPVPSRRLGFSLGVDIIPRKYCSFDCIYCQVGKTTDKEIERRSFFDPKAIVDEIVSESKQRNNIDVVTFSGSGEPTLNADIGWMIRETKKRLKLPVCVITNSSLLFDEKVRSDLNAADTVLPSLDAVSGEAFESINRPHPEITIDKVIEGLRLFRAAYKGKMLLEIMLVKGANVAPEELEKMRLVIEGICPDKIQLNTVTRPPTEETASGVSRVALKKACAFFGDRCEIICKFEKKPRRDAGYLQADSLSDILSRRSLTLDDVVKITGITTKEARKTLQQLEGEGKIKSTSVGSRLFYQKVRE